MQRVEASSSVLAAGLSTAWNLIVRMTLVVARHRPVVLVLMDSRGEVNGLLVLLNALD